MRHHTHKMISVPGGTVDLRDDRSSRLWSVEVQPFLLGVYPVTAELYHQGATVSDPLRPIVGVSWLDAVNFCNELSRHEGLDECYVVSKIADDGMSTTCDWHATGYRLPTEAEWQHACRAGTSSYQYGELNEIAWYRDNSAGALHDVGGKAPNAWGLYDMLGNVWEWCWDLYDIRTYGPYRIFRGGSWAEEARGCGSTCRRRSHPTFAIDDLGFRLARTE